MKLECKKCGNVKKPAFTAIGKKWCGHCGCKLTKPEVKA